LYTRGEKKSVFDHTHYDFNFFNVHVRFEIANWRFIFPKRLF
jgi:hypothetical protein